jgi:1,4-dihydroxy-2-naphthoate octaprenyltransferase
MKIFDCFIYLVEDFLLDLRFNILNNYVKYRKLMDHTSPEYRDLLDMLRRSLKGNGLA